jgi:polysaccharide deacetylase 2 family uncharacterized protein YibQ|tara:strand:+ start:847 stop:1161 length:315 start_codon:yes stop_codon:yes gene_type:complete
VIGKINKIYLLYLNYIYINKKPKQMSKTKKITSKELEEVKEQQNEIQQALLNIGNAEVVKNQMISKHLELQEAWKTMTQTLEKKYGAVNISLEDGTLSPIEDNA